MERKIIKIGALLLYLVILLSCGDTNPKSDPTDADTVSEFVELVTGRCQIPVYPYDITMPRGKFLTVHPWLRHAGVTSGYIDIDVPDTCHSTSNESYRTTCSQSFSKSESYLYLTQRCNSTIYAVVLNDSMNEVYREGSMVTWDQGVPTEYLLILSSNDTEVLDTILTLNLEPIDLPFAQ